MSALLAWVALYRTESTTLGSAGDPLTGPSSLRCGTREQAEVTWRAVATEVPGANCTTIHCWPSAAFILAQPASAAMAVTRAAIATLTRVPLRTRLA